MLISLQQTVQAAQEILEVAPVEKTMSIAQLLKDSGLSGQIIIYIILVLLAIGLFIYFERVSAINAASKIDNNFMNQIKDYISKGKLENAKMLVYKVILPHLD